MLPDSRQEGIPTLVQPHLGCDFRVATSADRGPITPVSTAYKYRLQVPQIGNGHLKSTVRCLPNSNGLAPLAPAAGKAAVRCCRALPWWAELRYPQSGSRERARVLNPARHCSEKFVSDC